MTIIMSSLVNALVEWRFMVFGCSIKDALVQSCDVTICERFQLCGLHALDQDFHASPVFLGRWVCPFQGKERMAVFGPWALPTAEVGAALWAEVKNAA